MFKAFKNKIQVFNKLTARYVFHQLFMDNDFTDYIIELNTQYQLYDLGIDSTGRRLDEGRNGYAPVTIMLKEERGQPTDRVTLKDTGAFYESFRCKWLNNGDGTIKITADTIKDQTDLLVEWGKEILGLDEESLGALRNLAAIKMKKIIEYELKQAA